MTPFHEALRKAREDAGYRLDDVLVDAASRVAHAMIAGPPMTPNRSQLNVRSPDELGKPRGGARSAENGERPRAGLARGRSSLMFRPGGPRGDGS